MNKYSPEQLRAMARQALEERARRGERYTLLIGLVGAYSGIPAHTVEAKIRELAR